MYIIQSIDLWQQCFYNNLNVVPYIRIRLNLTFYILFPLTELDCVKKKSSYIERKELFSLKEALEMLAFCGLRINKLLD